MSRICPHCGEYSRVKIGFTKKTGYQRYKCTLCRKCSSDSPFPLGSSPIDDQPKCKSIIDMRAIQKKKDMQKKLMEENE